MRLRYALAAVALTFAATHPAAGEDKPQFAGDWYVVSVESEEQTIPEEKVRGIKLTFKDEAITVVNLDRADAYTITYSLNQVMRPIQIDAKVADGKTKGLIGQGIIEMPDAKTLRICYATGTKGRPLDFKTKAGGTVEYLVTLKKELADSDPKVREKSK